MPTVYLKNVPPSIVFHRHSVLSLHERLKTCTGHECEVIIEDVKHRVLSPDDGEVRGTNSVRVVIELYGGRSADTKEKIVMAVQIFLVLHGIGEGSDITFREYLSESFYVEGDLVPGGQPRS